MYRDRISDYVSNWEVGQILGAACHLTLPTIRAETHILSRNVDEDESQFPQ